MATTKTKTGKRRRRNLDPLLVGGALSSAQGAFSTAKSWGLDKHIDRAYDTAARGMGFKNPEDIDRLNAMAPYTSQGHIEFTPDGIERFTRDGYVYRAFSDTPVFGDGYRMGSVEGTLAEFSMTNPAKFDRCVTELKKKGTVDNAYAVCTAAGASNPARKIWVQPKTEGKNAPSDKWTVGVVGFPVQTFKSKRGAISRAKSIASNRDNTGSEIIVNEHAAQLRNPESEANAVYEDFHGAPPQETLEYHETLHFHANLGGLADLVHIVVMVIGGTKDGKELQLNAPDPTKAPVEEIVRLTSNEKRNQLYFVGGDQTLDLEGLGFRENFVIKHDGESFDATEIKDDMVIGYIYRIMYRTEKSFDNFETIDYHHAAGEDTGAIPFLTYNTLNKRMGVAGGSYAIHPEGIVN